MPAISWFVPACCTLIAALAVLFTEFVSALPEKRKFDLRTMLLAAVGWIVIW